MTDIHEFLETLSVSTEPFRPFVFHNIDGDCLEFYVSQNNFYGKYIDNYLSILLDMDTDEIVGFIIDNIKYIANKVIAENGEIQLDDLVARIGKNNKEYEKIIEIAKSNGLDKISFKNNNA
jgi:hypothetical protein